METSALSLLTVDAIPEDADCVMIYAPASDISQEEKELLAGYAAEGGKLFVVAGPVQDGILENLYSLLADYGVEANKGMWWKEIGSITPSRGLLHCCPT